MKETSRKKNINIEHIIIKLCESPYNERSFAIRDYEIEGLCVLAKGIFLEQPMLLELEAPIQICGDTHGQFKDLQTIFKLFGSPSDRNYIFLGDYVDRGKQSLECICLLLAYKIKYPNNFFLLRGNHESSELNKLYGFYDECKRRTNLKMWKTISDTFNFFPIAAIISNRIFCVHGGLSPHIKNLSSLNSIKRPIDPMGSKIICDLLWSDPKPSSDGWSDNF
jgi:serine/threonine-protein phosphatase PP1 catalytic subunit